MSQIGGYDQLEKNIKNDMIEFIILDKKLSN